MSLLARVLIIVQALLVMVYLGVSATLFQHRRDWRGSYYSLKGRYGEMVKLAKREIGSVKAVFDKRKDFINLKNDEISKLKTEKDRADNELQARSQDLSRKTTDYQKLLQDHNKFATANDTLRNQIKSLRSDIDELQANLDENNRRRNVAETQVGRLETITTNLNSDIRDLSREFSEVQTRQRQKSLLIAMAEERGVSFATLVAGQPPKLVRGRVSAVKTDMDPPLVVIDVGSDDGVEIGYPLSVFRGRLFVGKLIVERVESGVAACRVHFAAEGQSIQPGDSITTRLP